MIAVRRRRRGGGFLLFMLVLLPMMLMGLSLVTDYASTLLAHRRAATVADAVSMAAATAFDAADPTILDQNTARLRAQAMFDQSSELGIIPGGIVADATLVSVVFPAPDRVTITIEFTSEDLFLASALTPGDINITGRVVRTAEICDPRDGSVCAYPLS